MNNRSNTSLFAALLLASPAAVLAQSDADPFELEVEAYGGRAVVPPDIIEADIEQNRLEGVIGGAAIARYKIDDTRLFARVGAEVFPVESLFNRYAVGIGASQDIPIAQGGRIRARLGGTYDHVIGEEGRVFNRIRGDAQLIVRHGGGHTSVARVRYGYRNQSEERFSGFDQDELVGEVRHQWRRPGSDTSINVAAYVIDIDAEDDRFSYQGIGLRAIVRAPLGGETLVFARVSYVTRDFEDPFNQQFPIARDDDVWRISGGIERPLFGRVVGFGEVGYIDNASNIPTRDFSGLIGRAGIRVRLD
ncbi:hypothetical protein [uncultured Erythrobacter sp.]|uniref:hypothetical protein n=1 Tax=uncultured Erythrobacter sp. TaxID=263913 RepID=UPI00261E072B|nr:hypothetical protein [uncultured Erythrobacter sp.]